MHVNSKLHEYSTALALLFNVATFFAVLAISAQAFAQDPHPQFITFAVSSAGRGSGQGTVPRSINVGGAITGEYYDSSVAAHGFVRAPDGTIATFDAPGASTAIGQGTFPRSINSQGLIAGFYYYVGNAVAADSRMDARFSVRSGIKWVLKNRFLFSDPLESEDSDGVYTRGFVRSPDGSITPFDAGPNLGTIPLSINAGGAITGAYSNEGFVRAPGGAITTFSVGIVTVPTSINQQGEITGMYEDASFACHGFLRALDGTIVTFDPAGSVCTDSEGIDDSGTVTGEYSDSSNATHGFTRTPNGDITTFDVSEAGVNQNTAPTTISDLGIITGAYMDASGVLHGFVRPPDGTIVTFNTPGAGAPFEGDGTSPQSINLLGTIAGWYSDTNGTYHGFFLTALDGTEGTDKK